MCLLARYLNDVRNFGNAILVRIALSSGAFSDPVEARLHFSGFGALV